GVGGGARHGAGGRGAGFLGGGPGAGYGGVGRHGVLSHGAQGQGAQCGGDGDPRADGVQGRVAGGGEHDRRGQDGRHHLGQRVGDVRQPQQGAGRGVVGERRGDDGHVHADEQAPAQPQDGGGEEHQRQRRG